MPEPADKLTLLERRELEARIVGPLVRGFIEELGAERALAIVRRVVSELAREAGAERARALGDASLAAFGSLLEQWRAGGALEIQILRQDDEHLDFNVTRCRFAEMYRALGLADLGASLSCCRDFSLVEGFNPALKLVRTQTLMEGANHCDFRFHRGDAKLR
jgi:class 3 adenylate cyclase